MRIMAHTSRDWSSISFKGTRQTMRIQFETTEYLNDFLTIDWENTEVPGAMIVEAEVTDTDVTTNTIDITFLLLEE